MKNMPKSLEIVEKDDFFSSSKGAVVMRFNPQRINVQIKNQTYLIGEEPSITVLGSKKKVIAIA